MSKEQDKAAHYIQLLDTARRNGSWQEVPELVRKITKHAPQRKCLILAARSEHEVASYARARPGTPGSQKLAVLIPALKAAVEAEDRFDEDALQAQVCLGWMHWALNEPGLAISELPPGLIQGVGRLEGGVIDASPWTKISAIKGTYIRGAALLKTKGPVEALSTFTFALPLLSQMSLSNEGSELRLWLEKLLSSACQLAGALAAISNSRASYRVALEFFRTWARFWDGRPSQGALIDEYSFDANIPRRTIWKAYYETLTRILTEGFSYLVDQTVVPEEHSSPEVLKLRQWAELQRVQIAYEGLLLREIPFPKANDANGAFEEWTELVMRNWMTLCGDFWVDKDLGEGGKQAVSRNVLDILYRAAGKTFHSTPILRYLFTVHAYIGELEIAFKAFDTYLELVTNGKEREVRSEILEPSLDTNDLVLQTTSQAISLLCRFGGRKEGERAKELGDLMQSWLQAHDDNVSQDKNQLQSAEMAPQTIAWANISTLALQRAHCAIGVSEASWASQTYLPSARAGLHNTAMDHFRRSLELDSGDMDYLDAHFGFGVLLAETRKHSHAIEVVKSALSSSTSSKASNGGIQRSLSMFYRERQLLPLWHLLALLLSARQDFSTASKACEAAFEQFQTPENLFGSHQDPNVQSEAAASISEKSGRLDIRGAIDVMETYDKATLLQIKMTQIGLIEATEGPDAAVNASEELLALYGQLFENPRDKPMRRMAGPALLAPPKSSSGTLRSMSGSIFGRPRSLRKTMYKPGAKDMIEEDRSSSRPVTAASKMTTTTAAPTIEVTHENGNSPEPKTHHRHLHLGRNDSGHGGKLQKSNNSLRKQKSFGSFRRHKATKSGSTVDADRVLSPAPQLPVLDRNNFQDRSESQMSGTHLEGYNPTPSQVGLAVSPDIPSPAPSPQPSHQRLNADNQPSAFAPRSSAQTEKSQQTDDYAHDLRLLKTNAHALRPLRPKFSAEEDRQLRSALLVQVWLLIAVLYRRMQLFDDAEGAVAEASGLVEELQLELSQDQSSSRRVDNESWSCSKSILELWGDVCTERGNLCRAQSLSYEALAHYEAAVSRCADHPAGTVGLSNILLDISNKTLLPRSNVPDMSTQSFANGALISNAPSPDPILSNLQTKLSAVSPQPATEPVLSPLGIPHPNSVLNAPLALRQKDRVEQKSPARNSPEELDRLAARDRAYGLLSTLTKLGSGWDYSEAWFALARAYDEGNQPDKEREALWWCVELEDARPIRAWKEVASGGYVL